MWTIFWTHQHISTKDKNEQDYNNFYKVNEFQKSKDKFHERKSNQRGILEILHFYSKEKFKMKSYDEICSHFPFTLSFFLGVLCIKLYTLAWDIPHKIYKTCVHILRLVLVHATPSNKYNIQYLLDGLQQIGHHTHHHFQRCYLKVLPLLLF